LQPAWARHVDWALARFRGNQSPDGLREVIRTVLQVVLEAEMDEPLGASKGERTRERLGYRSAITAAR
jgi:transposase-like protein